MDRYKMLLCLAALSLSFLACNTAHADRLASTSKRALAPSPAESPYQIDLIGENGEILPVYRHRGRFYILGRAGQRYSVRVSNPTARRVEAVISVDGLDVIDGKTADLRKRGYVVPPWGEVRVDGFRVSTRQVAAFRFSSVASSYAGRKGQARNVGVIGVAIFEERGAPQIVIPERRYHSRRRPRRDYDYRMDLEEPAGTAPAPKADRAPADRAPSRAGRGSIGGSAGEADSADTRSAPRARRKAPSAGTSAREGAYSRRCCGQPSQRPGLGTEFGERRHSAVSWTQFVRATPKRPTAVAEFRYNDAPGLQALGIQLYPVSADELSTRETANPFPGSGFARPPR